MELWRDIEGYENYLQVSNKSRVRDIKRNRYRKPRVINSGYLIVTLRSNNHPQGRHRQLVHRLVAKAFCEGFQEGLDVNHKDGDRLNNHADNLEWLTRRENIRDCMRRGKHNVTKAQEVARIKNQRRVAQYTMSGDLVNVYESAKEASEAVGTKISRAAYGTRKSAAGFKWKYLD